MYKKEASHYRGMFACLCGNLRSVAIGNGTLVGILEVGEVLLSGSSGGGITLGSGSLGSVAIRNGTLVGVLEIGEVLLSSSSGGSVALSSGLGSVAVGNGTLVGVLEIDKVLLAGSGSISALGSRTVDGGSVKGPRVAVSERSNRLGLRVDRSSKGEASEGGDEGSGLHDC
jgi:hypothetical protein